MSKLSRILILLSSILLILVFIFPIWSISLEAPQYPEGIGIYINVHSITGHRPNNLNSINNLNHYIGMKRIEPDSILELKIMPYIIAFFIVFGFLNYLLKKRWLIFSWVALFCIVGIIGMYDFWLWEYDYGHNLNPLAIIKIPGMSYQPPIFGSEKLLNFTATSLPDIGGIMIGISIILAIIAFIISSKKKISLN